MKPPCVLIGVPAYTGQLGVDFVNSLLGTYALFTERGIALKFFCYPGCSVLPLARNEIAAAFLGDPDATHLLWIDADMGWQPMDVLRLLSHDLPLVAGVGGARGADRPCCSLGPDGSVEVNRDAGLVLGHAVGFGFVMTRRDCLEHIADSYPERRFRHGNTYTDLSEPMSDFFPHEIIDGLFFGEDYGFCRLWRDCGGEVWLDPYVKLRHAGVDFDPLRFFGDLMQEKAG